VKTTVKERVMEQSTLYISHISWENNGKRVKRPPGPRSNSSPGRQNKNTFVKQRIRKSAKS
jgi:hypothetical protein